MRKSFVFVPAFALAAACFGFLMTDASFWHAKSAAAQEEQTKKVSFAKDLQVMEFKDMIELQNYMKTMAESLGVTCSYCHNLTNFAETNEDLHKDEAREMMKLTNQLNETFFKDSEDKVTCFTCHRGHEHPANTKEAWAKQMESGN